MPRESHAGPWPANERRKKSAQVELVATKLSGIPLPLCSRPHGAGRSAIMRKHLERTTMTMQTQLRKISATVRDGNDAEEFSYKALDFAHYVKTDPALKEGVDAMVAFARQASDIKAHGTYRRLRRGGEKRKPLTQDAACAWMLNEYEADRKST